MHTCPIQSCSKVIGYHLLMCPAHWWMVPQRLRNTINLEWKRNEGASQAYLDARAAAIKHVNERQEREHG